MARVTVEDCLEKVNNRFALVLLASKRARQLNKGARSLVDSKNKAPVTALREIASGRVHYDKDVRGTLEEVIARDKEILARDKAAALAKA